MYCGSYSNRHRMTSLREWPTKEGDLCSGVTEQCGALSQSSGSGPLFFANHVYRLRLPLTAYIFYSDIQLVNNIH